MKKVFISLLCLPLVSSVWSDVHASGLKVGRDAGVGILYSLFFSDKDKKKEKGGGTFDPYADRLGESIKVISSIKTGDFKKEQNKERLESITMEEAEELHSRIKKSCVKRTCDDIHDNLQDCLAGCNSCCCGCWDYCSSCWRGCRDYCSSCWRGCRDYLKRFCNCPCCSKCCSGRRGCCNNYESLSLDDNNVKDE